ncbi:MAG: deoxyribonuclease IV [Chloroflexi bacterium]|nr:deoxyribonuclease IV [Chloroflexota bacterium]
MRLGAHVSAAGSIDKAIERAQAIGAEAIQVFASGPQGWRYKEHPEKDVQAFREKAKAADVRPVFLHGVYLVNLATESGENLEKGVESLAFYMRTAGRLGASGVIFHAGSHKGAGLDAVLPQVSQAIRRVLSSSPAKVWLVLENNAGTGQQLGAKFEELRRIMDAAGDDRVKVCLDTAHTLANGYDLRTPKAVEQTMREFDRTIGLANLVAVHANDSKVPLGGNADRHENIGEGHIGREGFKAILGHPAFRDVPFFLEVPGFGNTGPDKENLDRLKGIRAELGLGS